MRPLSSRIEELYQRIQELVSGPVALMEVCGTHTMAIGRFGLRSRLPRDLRLISGPGCPVCVTSAADVDRAIALSMEPGVIVTTFGDLLRVPGSRTSLQRERGRGAQVQVVYSPTDALALALAEPSKKVVFIGVGFETTSPTIAATLVRAAEQGVGNFYVLPAFKVVPPAMELLASSGETRLDGFICPGHVSTIIGSDAYLPIAEKHHLPCVVTGFEALDILLGVESLLAMHAAGQARVENQYRRAVTPGGNARALELMDRVFELQDAHWRGIGLLPGTGLGLRKEFRSFDALLQLPMEIPDVQELPHGCSCGQVMRGIKTPRECALFGRACLPSHPVGPCMVSSEGACAAWYKYGEGAPGEST